MLRAERHHHARRGYFLTHPIHFMPKANVKLAIQQKTCPPPRLREYFFYVATDAHSDLYKVGHTRDIASRIRTYKTGQPDFAMIVVVRANRKEEAIHLEREAKKYFAKYLYKGEVFRIKIHLVESWLKSQGYEMQTDGTWYGRESYDFHCKAMRKKRKRLEEAKETKKRAKLRDEEIEKAVVTHFKKMKDNKIRMAAKIEAKKSNADGVADFIEFALMKSKMCSVKVGDLYATYRMCQNQSNNSFVLSSSKFYKKFYECLADWDVVKIRKRNVSISVPWNHLPEVTQDATQVRCVSGIAFKTRFVAKQ